MWKGINSGLQHLKFPYTNNFSHKECRRKTNNNIKQKKKQEREMGRKEMECVKNKIY
jgi:hypothetical protein